MRYLLPLLLAAACSSSTPAPSKPEPVRPSSTGALTEAEFKALHAPPTAGPEKLDGQDIDLKGTKAYLSLPKGTGPFPAIVVIHEWWGLNSNVKHWADRLASAGWAALAVDLYSGVVATDRDTAMAAMKAVDDTKAQATIRAGLDFLAADPRIQAPKKAVIGWCFGGGWSLETALGIPDGIQAAVMYYGRTQTDPKVLAALKAPLLGLFGGKDQGIPVDGVRAMEQELAKLGKNATIVIYPEADHAFANPTGNRYLAGPAEDAWGKTITFFAQHLKN